MSENKTVAAFGMQTLHSPMAPMSIERRWLREHDVEIDIQYCGVCHTDLHWIHGLAGDHVFPLVPGHEIVGRVTRVGPSVSGFKVGDLAAIGPHCDSCRSCGYCEQHQEQYCLKAVSTYGSHDPYIEGHFTYGGYSRSIVAHENFVFRMPRNLDAAAAAPLVCAGATPWGAFKRWNVGADDWVGVIGLGGLGHMGVKLAKALGARVTVITTSKSKEADAFVLGADEVLVSTDADAMMKHDATFSFLLNTVPVPHDMNVYVPLLRPRGVISKVGTPFCMPENMHPFVSLRGLVIAGSITCGMEEAQEMLDFCGKHNVVADIEMVDIKDLDRAFERIEKNDVKYRFVIDMSSLDG